MKHNRIIKTVLKGLYHAFLVISIVILFYSIIISNGRLLVLNSYNDLRIKLQQKQINVLRENDSSLLNKINEINSNLEYNFQDIFNKLDKIINKVSEPDLDRLFNCSVSVNGIDGAGSGTVIKNDETGLYILTCAHVVRDVWIMNKIGVTHFGEINYYQDGRKVISLYEIIKYDEEIDLAILKCTQSGVLDVAKLADNEPKKGDIVYSIGDPLGMIRTLSKGILANIIPEDDRYITDNTTTYGNSGGGLFNQKGELIGVPANVRLYGYPAEGLPIPESSLGMSIDLSTIRSFIAEIL